MDPIKVVRPERAELEAMGVFSWPIWTKESSTFDWHYDESETCYLLEGKVRVEPKPGEGDAVEPVDFGAGDLVTFPKGLGCTWTVSEPVRKHYKFG